MSLLGLAAAAAMWMWVQQSVEEACCCACYSPSPARLALLHGLRFGKDYTEKHPPGYWVQDPEIKARWFKGGAEVDEVCRLAPA